MKNEKKFLFKRKMKLLCTSSIILVGITLILWFSISTDNIIDSPLEETEQDPLEDTFGARPKAISKEIPNKPHSNLPSTNHSNPKVNSHDSNLIPPSHPEKSHSDSRKMTKPIVMVKLPSQTKFKESSPTTTHPIKIKDYKTFNLTLRNETKSPDGFSRHVYTINNQFPGPEIIVNKGDMIRINVTNYIGQPTTIHVHGMIHKETVYMDGVPYVTQCPVQNGSNFIYEFKAEYPGTYW